MKVRRAAASTRRSPRAGCQATPTNPHAPARAHPRAGDPVPPPSRAAGSATRPRWRRAEVRAPAPRRGVVPRPARSPVPRSDSAARSAAGISADRTPPPATRRGTIAKGAGEGEPSPRRGVLAGASFADRPVGSLVAPRDAPRSRGRPHDERWNEVANTARARRTAQPSASRKGRRRGEEGERSSATPRSRAAALTARPQWPAPPAAQRLVAARCSRRRVPRGCIRRAPDGHEESAP